MSTPAPSTEVTITTQAAARLADLLEQCETILSTPPLRAELAEVCLHRPGISSGWLIDLLGLHALHPRARLADAHQDRGERPHRRPGPRPRHPARPHPPRRDDHRPRPAGRSQPT